MDTSKVQTLEVQLVDQSFPFGHDLILFVTESKIRQALPSFRVLKINFREPGNKKWHVTTNLIMEYMKAETSDGALLGCPIVKSDPSLPACIVDGSFVMDFSGVLRCLLCMILDIAGLHVPDWTKGGNRIPGKSSLYTF